MKRSFIRYNMKQSLSGKRILASLSCLLALGLMPSAAQNAMEENANTLLPDSTASSLSSPAARQTASILPGCAAKGFPAIPYPSKKDLHSPEINRIIHKMSIEDMAAQTMVLRSKAKPEAKYVKQMQDLLSKHPFGGICFFAGKTGDMLQLQQAYRQASELPLWMSIDGETGPGMRLTDITRFPLQQALGAISDEELVYAMGRQVGRQCRLLGIQWNFLPDADVNNNPDNPVINTRSFGEDPERVARLAGLYLSGLQVEGIMGSAKHFPGHGDTETDSHHALPLIAHSRQQMDSIHLWPFKELIKQGVESVMVAHLNLPAYDSNGLPASLSPAIVNGLLREELGYRGLVVTDGLEMAGVRSALNGIAGMPDLEEGSVEVQALVAGCDVLLLPVDPEAAIRAIAKAVKKGILPKERLEDACRRILYYKLAQQQRVDFDSCPSDFSRQETERFLNDSINTADATALRQAIYDRSATLVENFGRLLPLPAYSYPDKLCINIGYGSGSRFGMRLLGYEPELRQINLHRDFDFEKTFNKDFRKKAEQSDLLIVCITNTNYSPAKNYGITPQTVRLVDSLQNFGKPVVLVVFAPPYALKPFYEMPKIQAILCGYQEVAESQIACADILTGRLGASGRLPVSIAKYWPAGHGIQTQATRFGTRPAWETGLDPAVFPRIDSLIESAIGQGAMPGCQVFVAKDGMVVYDRSFGHPTYDSSAPVVETNDLYDIASLTKIMATTLAYMRLYEDGVYDLDEPVSDFLPRLRRTDKRNITFRELLSHQSGLKSYIPYVDLAEPVWNGMPVFDSLPSAQYPVQIADSLYLQAGYAAHIRELIDESPVNRRKPYVYSDLGFYYLNEALQVLADTSLDAYVEENFYRFLELENIGFHPLERFEPARIMPTENDTVLRHRQIRGFVHDPLIALTGGAGGSAGLFSNAHDVGVIAQMLLQGGEYGGIQYFNPGTVDLFTSNEFSPEDNRRGGGFDKPPADTSLPSPTAPSASISSFGHSGFTGTYFWVDPADGLVYVFLSNRVYPSAGNNLLTTLSIRTTIQEYLHQACTNRQKRNIRN